MSANEILITAKSFMDALGLTAMIVAMGIVMVVIAMLKLMK